MAVLTSPLDSALGSTSKVRLLRLLIEQDRTVSAREAARLTKTSRTAILAAIEDLVRIGLVTREESGRQFLCRANREHLLIQRALQPLFSAESAWPTLVFAALRAAVLGSHRTSPSGSKAPTNEVIAAWIFGSAAVGRDKPGSDVDLFVLTRADAKTEETADRVAGHLYELRMQLGVDVRPIVMSRDRFGRELKAGNRLIRTSVRDARMVVGVIPREFKIGKENNKP